MDGKAHQQPKKPRQQLNTPDPQPIDPQQQPYDNLLKRLVAHQHEAIIRLLLGDSSITGIEAINVEMLLPIKRGDLVYRIFYQGEWHILHFEFESSPNGKMDKRLNFYNAFLWYEY